MQGHLLIYNTLEDDTLCLSVINVISQEQINLHGYSAGSATLETERLIVNNWHEGASESHLYYFDLTKKVPLYELPVYVYKYETVQYFFMMLTNGKVQCLSKKDGSNKWTFDATNLPKHEGIHPNAIKPNRIVEIIGVYQNDLLLSVVQVGIVAIDI
ncbi:MAG: hypothetical protein SFU99_17615 [Saprospiraceae bacterium]|nr:hypothetical protein [Saprospiraceae bacterium]